MNIVSLNLSERVRQQQAVEERKRKRAEKIRRNSPKKHESPGRVKTKWVVRGEAFYSKREAAEYFGVTEQTIRKWCKGSKTRGPEKDCYAEIV